MKIYTAYALDNGRYPGVGNYCLGEGYDDGLCWDNRTYTSSSAVSSELEKYVTNEPNPSTARVYRNATDGDRAGILYVSNYTLRYQLEGASTECGIAGAYRSFTTGESTGPECTAFLPDPTKL